MEYFGYVLLLFATFLFFIAHPIICLLHELGHAIPIVLITKQPVNIFIGSYANPEKSLKLRIGLFRFYIAYNIFLWKDCCCELPSNDLTNNQSILVTVCGPIASFIVAMVLSYFAFFYDAHGAIKLVLILMLGLAILDLYINLIPNYKPKILSDGQLVYNDGHQIKRFLYYKRVDENWGKINQLFNQGQYEAAAPLAYEMLDMGFHSDSLYTIAMASFAQLKDYHMTLRIFDCFAIEDLMTDNDFLRAGFIHSKLKKNVKALELYEKALRLNPDSELAWSNIGFTCNVLELYLEAIVVFDKVIIINNQSAYAYTSRGLSKIRMGDFDAGLKDINYALELDNNDPYANRNLGIYYLHKKDYNQALALLTKAKALETDIEEIDELILEAEEGIKMG